MRSDEMADINPDALLPDGLDDAYIGHTISPAGRCVAVYDADACVRVMARDSGMSMEEAEEYLEHNTFCAYVGPDSPLYVRLTRQSGYANL